MTRVNARLSDDTEAQLRFLTEATGQSVSHVLRESVAHYYVHVKQQHPRPPSKFLALAGKFASGRPDTSSRYKELLSESLEAKHRPPPGR